MKSLSRLANTATATAAALPEPAVEQTGCSLCQLCRPGRRMFTSLLGGGLLAAAMPSQAQVEVGERSKLSGLIPAETLEARAAQEYQDMLRKAAASNMLAPDNHPQVRRLRSIARRLIPFVNEPNLKSTPRNRQWKWEVNIMGGKQINAFCMPGGKIAFFYGILQTLQLSDDEVAMIMGHEIAHALREHSRERYGKTMATQGLISLGASLLGLGDVGRQVAGYGGQLLSLRFGREDESEADTIGLQLAAQAGYNPRAGISLWQKMGQANKGAPPEWLSTHPSDDTRIHGIEANLPKVLPLFENAPRPPQVFGPPKAGSS
jgi:predicted Zn-dependent protease